MRNLEQNHISIKKITNSSDISNLKEALIDMTICEVNSQSSLADMIYGGDYIKYTFVKDSETYEIFVANRRIEVDDKVYLVYGEYPTE